MQVFAVFVEQPVRHVFAIDRPVFALQLSFVFFLNMFLKSVITADLTSSPDSGRPTTLAQLGGSGVTVGITSFLVQSNLRIAASELPELQGLADRSHVCAHNLTSCIERLKVTQ